MSHSPLVVFPEHEEPIRAELFSVERLEQHAESLAAGVLQTGQRRTNHTVILIPV